MTNSSGPGGGNTSDNARMLERFRAAYIEEASELLVELEASLLELESTPGDTELIGRVFRALHTIKGSGAMSGFEAIASFTHQVESVFDDVRGGRLAITPALIGVTLRARDHIHNLLRASDSAVPELEEAGALILKRLREAAPQAAGPEGTPAVPQPEQNTDTRTYRIRFDPHPDLLLDGTNPIPLLKELAGMGDCSLVAHVDRIPELDAFNTEECYTHWDAMLTTTAGENEIRDIFIFVEDRAELTVQCVDETDSDRRLRIGEILAERGDLPLADAETCLSKRPLAGELLVQAGLVSQDRIDAAMVEQEHLDAIRAKRQKAEPVATIRVPAAKLDSLVDIVGELVTVQARLSGYALQSSDAEANSIAEEVERLTELLRENTMSVRMLPIGETFSKFKRIVRDLGSRLGNRWNWPRKAARPSWIRP